MKEFETINPATEEKLAVYKNMSDGQILDKIETLEASFQIWKSKSVSQRIEFLQLLKSSMLKHKPALTLLITQTMGKPLVESKLELEKSISQLDYYIENGARLIQDQTLIAHYPDMRLSFQPLGIVFSVMPWNYPVWQFFRFAVGAWLVGNVILFKHSEITTAVALFLETLVSELDEHPILQSVIMEPSQSEKIVSHKSIRAVTFTGSTKVGRLIGEMSGRNLKKAVLELGGNDAFVVDETADFKKAAALAVKGRLPNNGQSCICAKRFFVPTGHAMDFMNAINFELQSYVIGNPLDKKTKLGPLSHKKFFDEYQKQLKFLKSISSVSTPPLEFPDSKGYYVSPYFFLIDKKAYSVKENARFFQEQEVFSPLGMVVTYEQEAELPGLVNASPYGLGMAWIGESEKFKKEKLHLKFNVGMVAVNDILKSDPRVPFGGVKDSGFGRESGAFGIYEFCNVQSVGIN